MTIFCLGLGGLFTGWDFDILSKAIGGDPGKILMHQSGQAPVGQRIVRLSAEIIGASENSWSVEVSPLHQQIRRPASLRGRPTTLLWYIYS